MRTLTGKIEQIKEAIHDLTLERGYEDYHAAVMLLQQRLDVLQSPMRLYLLRVSYGRQDLWGQFIAHPTFIERVLAFGPFVYLGEIAGKHSEVACHLSPDNLVEIGPADPQAVGGSITDVLDLLEQSCYHPGDMPCKFDIKYGRKRATWDDWNAWVDDVPGMAPFAY